MSGNEAGGAQSAADKAKQDALYENREPKKIIRIITVMAYMTSVSFVGIMLSGYYIFLWHPPNPRLMHAQAMHDGHEGSYDRLMQLPDDQSQQMKLLFETADEVGSAKMRRQIVNNVNAILSANLDKSSKPSSESPHQFDSTLAMGIYPDVNVCAACLLETQIRVESI